MERQTRLAVLLVVFASFFAAGAFLATAAADLSSAGAHLATMPSSSSSLNALRRVEDDDDASSFFAESVEEAAYPRRRALYDGGRYISYAGITASKAACYGPCPARGQAYSRGCLAIYQCRG